jgi:hypothetical protein
VLSVIGWKCGFLQQVSHVPISAEFQSEWSSTSPILIPPFACREKILRLPLIDSMWMF